MQTRTRILSAAIIAVLTSYLSACDSQQASATPSNSATTPAEQSAPAERTHKARSTTVATAEPRPVCQDCGVIVGIEQLKQQGEGTGMGAIAGAILGGVIAHQVGKGRGKDVATVAGAAGGAYAGNVAEKHIRGTNYYRVTVQMENGGTRSVDVNELNGLSNGSKVKVVGENLQPIG